MQSKPPVRPCIFIGSSRRDLADFPEDVRGEIGHALFEAQQGGEPVCAKALKGFGGRDVLEIVSDDAAGTYRTVYTVRFDAAIYVLHAFQKKSKRGIATPVSDIELIRKRLKIATEHYRQRFGV